jgi:ABC-type lipoprotein export system ATPase subunit
MIQLEHVTKVYHGGDGEIRALDDVTLEVAAGEFAAIRGPSGSGKSTLLAVMGALTTPTFGRVNVAGSDLGALSPAARARFRAENIGFVFQLFHLLPYLNVLENVLAAASGEGQERVLRAMDLLERFGLGSRLAHRPAELSVGERQRTALARALLNQPKIVLADEPTGNLDAASAAAVLDALSEFHREGGTLVIVTHDEAVAQRSGRTLTLAAGRLGPAAPTRVLS